MISCAILHPLQEKPKPKVVVVKNVDAVSQGSFALSSWDVAKLLARLVSEAVADFSKIIS